MMGALEIHDAAKALIAANHNQYKREFFMRYRHNEDIKREADVIALWAERLTRKKRSAGCPDDADDLVAAMFEKAQPQFTDLTAAIERDDGWLISAQDPSGNTYTMSAPRPWCYYVHVVGEWIDVQPTDSFKLGSMDLDALTLEFEVTTKQGDTFVDDVIMPHIEIMTPTGDQWNGSFEPIAASTGSGYYEYSDVTGAAISSLRKFLGL